MSTEVSTLPRIWTAEDLAARFGAIPMNRVRTNPAPGMGTVADVASLNDRENRLYELIDGVLLEKDMGAYESFITARIVKLLSIFVDENKLGIVLGADGMLELFPSQVRIPDVSFISFDRKPFEAMRTKAAPELVPDLAVEVVSAGNTQQEMDRKLHEYFDNGVRLVWYVYPGRHEAAAYSNPGSFTTIPLNGALNGGDVLPGFELKLSELFARPEPEEK